MKQKRLIRVGFPFKKYIFRAILALTLFTALFFGCTMFVIYKEVKEICHEARSEYRLDCVDSLTLLILSEDKSYRQKNSAVWALGQLADRKALPFLQELYTGSIPNKESLDKSISQYELFKAIKWCQNGNATSWMYKNIDKP